jgi:hypothetical protein
MHFHQGRVGPVKCGLGFSRPGLVCGLRIWTAGLAQKPGPSGLWLLVYVAKARAGPNFLSKITNINLIIMDKKIFYLFKAICCHNPKLKFDPVWFCPQVTAGQ